jgi:LysM repeat protein
MKPWKRLIYYLFLNVLVSACTTLAVLVIWDRTQAPAAPTTIEPAVAVSSALNTNTPSTQVISTTVASAAVTPNPTARSSPIGNVEAYEVEYGDTLGIISERFDVPVEELMRVNQLDDPNSLSIGMVLYIPVTPEAVPTQTPAPATSTPATSGSTTPSAPPQEARLIINAVIGTGDLASEHVFITRTGDNQLSLAGWQLKDEDNNVFDFPQLELYKDGAVNVWTTSGTNTVVDLYWGLNNPVWSSGEKVTLLDDQDKVRATYTVP